MPMVDIFMTTKNRGELLKKTLESFSENTDRRLYRFTLVRDGAYLNTEFAASEFEFIDHVITSRENEGLGPSMNRALAHIDATNRWWRDSVTHFMKGGENASNFVLYIQDDILFSTRWLETLIQRFMMYEKTYKIAFASGIECIEHETKRTLPDGSLLKDWIRATCMLAKRETWMSMYPIPRFDPETGRERAKPNDGMGSGVDWHFVRNHEQSVCKTGRTCLVVPGLLQHSGYDKSTWLKRELPESEADKKKIELAQEFSDIREELKREPKRIITKS